MFRHGSLEAETQIWTRNGATSCFETVERGQCAKSVRFELELLRPVNKIKRSRATGTEEICSLDARSLDREGTFRVFLSVNRKTGFVADRYERSGDATSNGIDKLRGDVVSVVVIVVRRSDNAVNVNVR